MSEILESVVVFMIVQLRRYAGFAAHLLHCQDGRDDSPVVASFGIPSYSAELQL